MLFIINNISNLNSKLEINKSLSKKLNIVDENEETIILENKKFKDSSEEYIKLENEKYALDSEVIVVTSNFISRHLDAFRELAK